MMVKSFLCIAVIIAVNGVAYGSIRRVRSPGPSGWQGSSDYGSSSIGVARSSGGWDNGASKFGRSNGWGGSNGYGANVRSYSNGYNSNGSNGKSGCPTLNSQSNGWDDSTVGFRSSAGTSSW